MNDLQISYGLSKSRKIFSIIIGSYFVLYGSYQSMLLMYNKTYNFNFYLALIATILGVFALASVLFIHSKPIFKLNSELIYVNMPHFKSVYSSEWIAIKEVSIGVSYFKFLETDSKTYNVDVSGLKYNDLKEVKSKIIEICESKKIPYKND